MPDALQVEVDERVFAAHPGYVAAVVLAEGIGNGPSDDASSSALEEAERALLARGLARAADDPHIAQWRAAFSGFGAKPKRYPCSAEALAARVLKGGALPRINVLVDLYNAISVRHLIPVGGEDLDRLEGPLRLTIADGSEAFDGPDAEPPKPGEVVWRDDAGVTCRRWNWRQGTRTRLTETSTRAFFVFDRLPALPIEALDRATSELSSALRARWPESTTRRIVLEA
jgi:DNA/RNA-binding domain of Phe-tRNA-synthetase-like protein